MSLGVHSAKSDISEELYVIIQFSWSQEVVIWSIYIIFRDKFIYCYRFGFKPIKKSCDKRTTHWTILIGHTCKIDVTSWCWMKLLWTFLSCISEHDALWVLSLTWVNENSLDKSISKGTVDSIKNQSKKMQKISLKVLLRFLSSYTHWNLVSTFQLSAKTPDK